MEDRVTSEFNFAVEPESIQGLNLIEDRFDREEPLTETVVVYSESLTVDDPAFQEVVNRVTAALKTMPELVDTEASPPVSFLDLQASTDPEVAAQAEQLISEDRKSTLIPVTLASADLPDNGDLSEHYVDTVDGQSTDAVTVRSVGAISVDHTFTSISEEDLLKGELIGGIFALVVPPDRLLGPGCYRSAPGAGHPLHRRRNRHRQRGRLLH